MWEKEKLLVTSNFSFSRIVFKRFVLKNVKSQARACFGRVKPFTDDKILALSKLKAIADDTLNVT